METIFFQISLKRKGNEVKFTIGNNKDFYFLNYNDFMNMKKKNENKTLTYKEV